MGATKISRVQILVEVAYLGYGAPFEFVTRKGPM